jgi:hypothetical protein
VGIGGTSGMVTDHSETFRLDNLESEVAGGACMTGLYAYIVTKRISDTLNAPSLPFWYSVNTKTSLANVIKSCTLSRQT